MNKILVLICCLVLSKATFAQKDSLAFDDNGKYIYYKVVNADGLPADTIYKRSLAYLEKANATRNLKITLRDNKTTSISGTGFFTITKVSLSKHPDGQIAYTFKMDVKDGKYRYWLSNFVYTPYFRDRYGNFVPDKGIETPFEKKSKNVTDKDLAKNLDESAAFGRQLGADLKKAIATQPVRKMRLDTTRRVHIDKTF